MEFAKRLIPCPYDQAGNIPEAKVGFPAPISNLSLLELIRTALKDALGIEGRFSSQKDTRSNRKVIYHLRIYRKDDVRKFLLNVETPKLKREKMKYVENWLQEKKERKEVEITS